MNTNRIIISVVTAGALLTGSLFAASGHDQARSQTKVKVRANKPTATTTIRTGGRTAVRTRNMAASVNTGVRTRNMTARGNTAVRTRTVNGRTVFVGGSSFGYGYPYSYGYPYYGYGYGPSVSFGFGYPSYGYGYYPYDYYGSYPYSYGYYNNYYRSGYSTYGNGSIVIQVQSRLARAGYYHGPIDGRMGPGTRFAIRAYERDHGMRVDGVISGPLVRNMGLRY